MSRQSLLACAWLGVVFGLAVVGVPAQSWSQDRATQERLDRLERDLNMLQRQVYRGAPAPPLAAGDGGGAVNAEIRMGRLEGQMRDLTGRVEEFINQIEQVRQRVEQIASDVEERFSQTAAGAGALGANPAPARPGFGVPPRSGRQFAAEPPRTADEDLMPSRQGSGVGTGPVIPPGTAVQPPGAAAPGAPTPVFGTLTPPGSPSAAPEVADAAPAGRPPAGRSLPGGSAIEQYNYALGLLKQANYPAAEAALKDFISQHPRDPMAGNAQYFIGDIYYERREYAEAASAFAEGYKRYPKSTKAPDDLLKLAMSLGRANQKPNACLALAQLDHDFPKPGASVKEHAEAEKKRLGC